MRLPLVRLPGIHQVVIPYDNNSPPWLAEGCSSDQAISVRSPWMPLSSFTLQRVWSMGLWPELWFAIGGPGRKILSRSWFGFPGSIRLFCLPGSGNNLRSGAVFGGSLLAGEPTPVNSLKRDCPLWSVRWSHVWEESSGLQGLALSELLLS